MSQGTLQPVKQRLISLDVLRGFALFGVLLVNMLDFSGSALRAETLGMRGNTLDQIVDIAIVFFAVTKFYLLFSFLFGVGFAVQMRRMSDSGRPFVGFYLRRLFYLFVIGTIHALLIWDGDILMLYAIAGLLLMLIRKLPNTILMGIALLIGVVGLVYFGNLNDMDNASILMNAEAVTVFAEGSYAEVVVFRLKQFAGSSALDIQIPMVLVMFIIGLFVGRNGLLDDREQYGAFLRRWWKPMLAVGLVGNTLLIIGWTVQNAWFVSIGIHIGAPALSFVYLTAVMLNVERLGWLAPVGRTALTSYLAQSVIGTTLFYGYGIGLYDQLAPTVTSLLVLIIFGAQVTTSEWWLNRYRFGPMEWLWRSLTYGSLQPMRIQAPVVTPSPTLPRSVQLESDRG
jgi:uncharacterized protein